MSEPFVSYSINHEDVVLRRLFPKRQDGFFIDVGAEHPIQGNDFYGLYTLGWTGLNIEPNPQFFRLLEQERPRDRTMNLALSDIGGQELVFHEVEGTGLSTCDEKRAETYAAEGYVIHRHAIRASTLREVLDDIRPPRIDILKVDVEGFEEQVLLGNDWQVYRPAIIMVEATYPQTPERRPTNIANLLAGSGYRHIHFDGLNDFYAELSFVVPPGATLPPNVFDNFVSSETADLKKNFAEAQTYAGSLAAERAAMGDAAVRSEAIAQFAGKLAAAAILSRTDDMDDLLRNNASPLNQQEPERQPAMQEQKNTSLSPSQEEASLPFRLEMLNVRLEALSQEKGRLAHDFTDLQHENRRLLESNSQLQGENLSLRQALAPAHALNDEVRVLGNRLEACFAGIDQRLRSGLDGHIETLVAMQSRHEATQSAQDSEASRLLQAVYGSTSWRLTRPLRAVMRLFKS